MTTSNGSISTEIGFHIVRYGTAADQKYLIGEFLKTYEQLVFNANIIAHMPNAIATFISQKTKQKKPFFIDPQTHAFQHDLSHIKSKSKKSKGKIKKSFQRLLEEYGDPVSDSILNAKRPLKSEDLDNTATLKGFCKRVIDFQWDVINNQILNSEDSKYFKYVMKEGELASKFRPNLLIAPYFYLGKTNFGKWLDRNIECVKKSVPIVAKKKRPLGVQIVLSQEVMESKTLSKRLISEYTKLSKVDYYLVWVNDLKEIDANVATLQSFIFLLQSLEKNAPVINLYGGFFSIALAKLGVVNSLAGVSHSLEYGESRPVVPVGGGVPVAKYYFPRIFFRLPFREALRAVKEYNGFVNKKTFFKEICDCRQCKKIIKKPRPDFDGYGEVKIINGKEYPTAATKENSVRHYMWCKQKEYKGGFAKKDLTDLDGAGKKLKLTLLPKYISHCKTWVKVLSNFG